MKVDRLEVRLGPGEKDRLARAAAADGITASRFVREAVAARVSEVLAELHEITLVDAADHAALLDQLRVVAALPAGDVWPQVWPQVWPEALCEAATRRAELSEEQAALLRTSPLGPQHVRRTFMSCDQGSDEWMRFVGPAGDEQCFVWCSTGYADVDGFYAVTPHRVALRGDGERGERAVPSLRLTQFAVGLSSRGTGRASPAAGCGPACRPGCERWRHPVARRAATDRRV